MTEPKTPEWIRKHEEDSWKSELLISGGAIYTLYQVPGVLGDQLLKIQIASDFDSGIIILLSGFVILSRVLLFGFALNLVIRAIWVALLAINQMYPEGPDFTKLGYHPRFEQGFKNRKGAVSKIILLEDLSGLSFAFSVFLAMITVPGIVLLYLLFEFVFPAILPETWNENPFFILGILFIYLASALGFFEFLAFKVGKRVRWIRALFAPIARVFSYLNTTRLFYWELQTVLSRYGKRRIALFLFTFMALSIVVSVNELDDYLEADEFRVNLYDQREFFKNDSYNTIYAEDYSEDNPEFANYYGVSIPNEVVKDPQIPLFVAYDRNMDATFRKVIDSLGIGDGSNFDRKGLRAMTRALSFTFRVQLDGQVVDKIRWYRTQDLHTGINGFKTYLRVDTLAHGPHELRVQMLHADHRSVTEERDFRQLSSIFFWKE